MEIYRQKYENFRHFDNLRWHISILTITAGMLLIAFSSGSDKKPVWWNFLGFGLLALFSAFADSLGGAFLNEMGVNFCEFILEPVNKII